MNDHIASILSCHPTSSMLTKSTDAALLQRLDGLIDTATVVIESIWPPPPSTAMSPQQQQQQKALPLRTFVQETLKRSRSSYSTLQTALYYLYKIRNKVPSEFLKRRNDQLYHNYQILSAHAAGLATPPPSPMHLQQDTFPTTSSTSSSASAVGATLPHSSSTTIDYFSLRASAPGNGGAQHASLPAHHTLPSPVSTASNASMSPPDSCESSTSPSTSTDSTTSSPSSTSANQPATQQLQHQQQQIQHQQQCNKILYCGRRTFLAALMVASKYLQDRNYSNKAWAKISGLSIKEINANELVFLKLMDYSLFVSHETFMRWTALLLAHGQEATRRFMQSADAASAAAIAMRVRHHQQQQQLQQQQQQQYLHSCLAASSNAIRAPSTTATAAASSCLGSGTVTTTTNTTTTTSALSNRDSNLASTPKQGDRGMKWAATHSRPDKQQLVQQQQQRTSAAASATETHEQEYRTMLPPHLVLTPPDHADEAYPVRESLNTTVSSIVHSLTATSHNLRHHPSASATHMTTTAVDNHVDYAAAIIPQAEHAGCKRRRDSDWL
ncbi:hypothetical protein BGW41_001804 [Actinomortierella wolfii]|nr:hypothetical protein BGW41_001804 [Actinomortierella wolfii]